MGNNIQYQHIHWDFFNIIQLAWDIEWIIAGGEAHNNDIFTDENVSLAFKNKLKVGAPKGNC